MAEPRSPTLSELLAEYGVLGPPPGIDHGPPIQDVERLATAVEADLFRRGVSDGDLLSRSTTLWTIMQLDTEIAERLAETGLDQRKLGDALKIKDIPAEPADPSAVVPVRENLAGAVRTYLEQDIGPRGGFGLAELTEAILRSARDPSLGALGRRLADFGVDVEAAIVVADALSAMRRPRNELDLAEFSESVRQVRSRLGGDSVVTASTIAAAIRDDHPEYAAGRFEKVDLRTDQGSKAITDAWLNRVRGRYDIASVRSTRHRVIDGELTVLALAELDADLAEDLRVDGVLRALTEEAEVRPRPAAVISDRADWNPDAIAETDLLGRERLAEALSLRVQRLAVGPSQRSFLVHIDGPWGSGKSTLLRFLRLDLERAGFLVVEINAWREQRAGVQWWTLLTGVRAQVSATTPWYLRWRPWLGDLWDRIRAGWVPFIAALLVVAALFIGVLTIADLNLTESAQAADSVLKIVSLASVAFAGVVAAARYLLPGSSKSAKGFVESNDNPMAQVRKLFARTLKRAGRPVVLLIDDIDRCDGEYVVDFLEVTQTLVRDAPQVLESTRGRHYGGPYVFVAADGKWIRTSYELHYETFKHTAAMGRPLGYLFLEKIFQLRIRIPMLSKTTKRAYLNSMLIPRDSDETAPDDQDQVIASTKDATSQAETETQLLAAAEQAADITDPVARMDALGDIAVRFSDPAIEDATEHWLQQFEDFLDPNPRSMKLFVNTYGVLRSLRTLEEIIVAPGPLALWTVIEIRWPYLADYLRDHPDAVEANAANPEDISRLLAAAEVDAVISDPVSGPLTPELIRQSAGSD